MAAGASPILNMYNLSGPVYVLCQLNNHKDLASYFVEQKWNVYHKGPLHLKTSRWFSVNSCEHEGFSLTGKTHSYMFA